MKKYFTIILAGMVIALLMPFSAYAGPNDSISDDGEIIESAELTSGAGAQRIPAVNGTGGNAAKEGAIVTPLTKAEIAEIKSLPVASAGTEVEGAENLLGPDTRMHVYSTDSIPGKRTALITFTGGRCTGWMAGANLAVTAGHCVHTGGTSGAWRPRTSFKVYPGYTGSSAPYGYCTAKQLYSVSGWTSSASPDYDYGAVKLNCTVGNTTGTFGWQYTTSFLNYPTIITGYPGDKPSNQWVHADRVRTSATRRLYYKNDTVGGVSGAPVWYEDGAGPYVIAIHAYGGNTTTGNSGTRIVQAVSTNIINWRNAP